MSGEVDLDRLLAALSPRLLEGEFVFCSIEGASYGALAGLQPVASIRESEGLSLILPRDAAQAHGLAFDAVFRQITLEVHSSLQGVGLTALVSRVLAEQSISVNVVAGYFHDHLFVPAPDAERALSLLESLMR